MIVFTGDLHAGASVRARHPQLAGDWLRALDALTARLLALHSEHGVSAVVLPGDACHRDSANGDELKALGAFVSTLRSAGIRTLAIQGNHDWQRGSPLLAALGVEYFDGRTVEVEGVRVHGVGYDPDAQAVRTAVRACPACDVLVVHSGFDWNLGYESAGSLSESDVPDAVGLVAAGHVHAPGRKGRCVSLGSVVATSFAETGERTAWTYSLGRMERIELASRALSVVDVVCEADLEDLDDEMAGLSRAMDSGAPRGALGAALLVRHVPEMQQAVLDRERDSPGVVVCRGVLSPDAGFEPSAAESDGVTLADAAGALLSQADPLVRQAALDICTGAATAALAAAQLRRQLEERHV